MFKFFKFPILGYVKNFPFVFSLTTPPNVNLFWKTYENSLKE